MEGDDPAGRALSQLVKDLQRAEAERGRTKPKVDYDAYRAQYKKRLAELDEEEQRGKSRRRRSITVSSIQPQPWQARDHAKHKQMRAEEETKLPEPKSDQITLPEQSHTAKTFPMVDSPPNVAASPPKQDMRSSRDTSQRGRDTSRTQDTGDTQRGDTLGKKTERKRGTEKGEQQTMFETPPPVKQATTTLKDKIFHTVDSIIRRHDHSDKDKSSSARRPSLKELLTTVVRDKEEEDNDDARGEGILNFDCLMEIWPERHDLIAEIQRRLEGQSDLTAQYVIDSYAEKYLPRTKRALLNQARMYHVCVCV